MNNLDYMIDSAKNRAPVDPVERDVATLQIENSISKRKRTRVAGGVLSVVSIIVVAVLLAPDSRNENELRFFDGSIASFDPLNNPPKIRVETSNAKRIAVKLESGEATFRVVKNRDRAFVVSARDTTVTVTGTTFRVSTNDEKTEVSVLEGSVLVEHDDSSIALSEGAQTSVTFVHKEKTQPQLVQVVPVPEVRELVRVDAEKSEFEAKKPATKNGPAKLTTTELKKLLDSGDRSVAAATVDRSRLPDDVESLFVASDIMRLDGRETKAVALLNRVIELHAADPRSNLAHFTIGTISLRKNPKRALKHFVAVQSSHPLYEEALARTVEAYRLAGDEEKANQNAAIYLRKFPNGVYKSLVK